MLLIKIISITFKYTVSVRLKIYTSLIVMNNLKTNLKLLMNS